MERETFELTTRVYSICIQRPNLIVSVSNTIKSVKEHLLHILPQNSIAEWQMPRGGGGAEYSGFKLQG